VLRHPKLLRAWLEWKGGSEALQAGEYRFDEPISPLDVLERLRRGRVLLHPVTIPEGLVLEEAAELLAAAGLGTNEALLAAFRDPGALLEIDTKASGLEGYLFPDTYNFPRNVSPAAIVEAMLKRFAEVVGPDFAARAAAVGLEPREAVTLASMIEKETGVEGERRRISRVFHNRLKRRIRLQCDPTVRYALHRAGTEVRQLTYDHLEFDSPWNTYRVYGLPPGPIASPGQASLDAALDPADGDELYFVASPEGGHTFSKDLESHRKAVREWRRHLRSSR